MGPLDSSHSKMRLELETVPLQRSNLVSRRWLAHITAARRADSLEILGGGAVCLVGKDDYVGNYSD